MVDISFLTKGKYFWSKNVVEGMIKELKKIQDNEEPESKERCFVEFVLEIEQSYRIFLRSIRDLPIIMRCRTKGDYNAHFGGEECAKLMAAFRFSSEKYLRQTNFTKYVEGSLYVTVCEIREKAKENEKYAWNIEEKVKQEYTSLGKDNTLCLLNDSGYGSLFKNDSYI